jgi:hypothetical protein
MSARPVLELDDPLAGVERTPKPSPAPEPRPTPTPASSASAVPPRQPRGGRAARPRPAAAAPALGERQGSTRFQVRLRDSMAKAVAETEAKIELEQPGLSLNEIREIAVWAMLADPSDAAVKAFVRDVIPDWLEARRRATHAARA